MALCGTVVTFLVTDFGVTHKATKRAPSEATDATLAKYLLTTCAAHGLSHMTPSGLERRGRGRWGRSGSGSCQMISLRNARVAWRTLPSIVVVVVVVLVLLLTRCQLRITCEAHCEIQCTDEKSYMLLLLWRQLWLWWWWRNCGKRRSQTRARRKVYLYLGRFIHMRDAL